MGVGSCHGNYDIVGFLPSTDTKKEGCNDTIRDELRKERIKEADILEGVTRVGQRKGGVLIEVETDELH